MLKLNNPTTTSPSNADPAPLPERRRSTFREPAAEVDLGLFGLPRRDPVVDDVPDLAVPPAVAEPSDVADAPMSPHIDGATVVVTVADEPDSVDVPRATDGPEATDVVQATDVVEPTDVVEASEGPDSTEIPEMTDTPDSTETPVAPAPVAPVAPDVAVVAPSQQRARHRADRAGNRRATGNGSFRGAPTAH